MKNLFKVENIQRMLGIIALVAVIGFGFAACSLDGADGDTIWFSINAVDTSVRIEFYTADDREKVVYSLSPQSVRDVIASLTQDDIVLNPDNTDTTIKNFEAYGAGVNFSIKGNHDSNTDTATVSINEKSGFKFVKRTDGTDQFDF